MTKKVSTPDTSEVENESYEPETLASVQELISDVIEFINERIKYYQTQPNSFIKDLEPRQVIGAIVTNIVVNMTLYPPEKKKSYKEVMGYMKHYMEQITQSCMDGWSLLHMEDPGKKDGRH